MSVLLILYIKTLLVTIVTTCEPRYFIPEGTMTRFQAMQRCKSEGAELASFETSEQYHELLRNLRRMGEEDLYYWVDGLSYWTADDSKWWFDGVAKDMSYSGWCSEIGQPQEVAGSNSYGEPCVALNYKGEDACWHDYPCFALFPAVCHISCVEVTPDVHYGEFCAMYDEVNAGDAVKECGIKSRDKTLLVMNDMQKYKRLMFHLKVFGRHGVYFWTSLHRDPESQTQWMWNSGKGPREEWTYWNIGQPDNPEYQCGLLIVTKSALKFENQDCNMKHYYICE